MADDERARFASFASSNSGDSDMMEYLVGLAEEERSQYAECPERADARAANNGDDATSMLPRLSMSTDGGSGVWHPNSAGNLVGGHDDDDDNDDDDGEALYSITPPPPDRRALGAQAAREGRSIRSENGDVVLRSITLRELDEADDDYENRDNDDDVDASPAQGARDDAMHANGIGDGGEGGGGGARVPITAGKMRWRRAVDSVVQNPPPSMLRQSKKQLDRDIDAVTTTTKLKAPKNQHRENRSDSVHGARKSSDRFTGWHLPDQFNLLEVYRIQPKWMLRPDCSFRMWWDFFILILVVYVSMVIPLRIGFSLTAATSDNLFFRDEGVYFMITLAIDLMFAADIVLNFRTGIEIREGTVELHPRRVAKHYCRTWLLVDILSTFPYEVVTRSFQGTLGCSFSTCNVVVSAGVNMEGAETSLLSGLKVLRLLKLTKLMRLLRIGRILKRHGDHLFVIMPFVTILRLVLMIFYLGHLCGCFFYYFSTEEFWTENEKRKIALGVLEPWVNNQFGDTSMRLHVPEFQCIEKSFTWKCNEHVLHSLCTTGHIVTGVNAIPVPTPAYTCDANHTHYCTLPSAYSDNIKLEMLSMCKSPHEMSHRYITSLYWSFATITTVGYGDVSATTIAERVFAIVAVISGGLLFSMLVAQMSHLLNKMSRSSDEAHHRKLDQLGQFLRDNPELPGSLTQRLVRLFRRHRQASYNVRELMQDVPISVQSDVAYFIYKNILEEVPFLRSKDEAFIADVCARLRTIIYPENCIVYRVGEPGSDLFIVKKGVIETLDIDMRTIVSLGGDCSYFGEGSIVAYFTTLKRKRTMRRTKSSSANRSLLGIEGSDGAASASATTAAAVGTVTGIDDQERHYDGAGRHDRTLGGGRRDELASGDIFDAAAVTEPRGRGGNAAGTATSSENDETVRGGRAFASYEKGHRKDRDGESTSVGGMEKTRSSEDRRPRRSQSTKYMFIRNETIRCRTRCIMCRLSFHDAEMLIDTYPELLPKLTEAHAAQVQFMQGSKKKLASDLVSSLRTNALSTRRRSGSGSTRVVDGDGDRLSEASTGGDATMSTRTKKMGTEDGGTAAESSLERRNRNLRQKRESRRLSFSQAIAEEGMARARVGSGLPTDPLSTSAFGDDRTMGGARVSTVDAPSSGVQVGQIVGALKDMLVNMEERQINRMDELKSRILALEQTVSGRDEDVPQMGLN